MVISEKEPEFVIAKGVGVEVGSDDEGFKDAWYRATIEETPSKSKRKKVLVRYATLIKEDGSTPLTEMIDPAFIRPLPPDDKGYGRNFAENDVVDASYRDGWWTGVVRKVLEYSRYRVYFNNPPDVLEFEGKDLRAHFDWVQGKWVRSEKQKPTTSMFSSGASVEVNHETEDLGHVWIPAIIIKETTNDTFYVKYMSPRDSDDNESKKSIVDSRHIRPTPPPFSGRDYDLFEPVDTVCELGWREGIITKILAGKRYAVSFKSANVIKEFPHSDLRPPLEWIDGNWKNKSNMCQESLVVPNNQKQLVSSINSGADTNKDKTEERALSTRIRNKRADQSTPCSESYDFSSSAKKLKLTVSLGSSKQSTPTKNPDGGNFSNTQAIVKTGRSKKNLDETPPGFANPRAKSTRTKGTLRSMKHDQLSIVHPGHDQSGSNECISCQYHLANWYLQKRKRQVTERSDVNPVDASKKEGRAVGGPLALAAPKEFDSSIVLGLKANSGNGTLTSKTNSKMSTKEPRKLKKDKRKSINDSAGDQRKGIKGQKSRGSSQKGRRGRPSKFVRPQLPHAAGQNAPDQKASRVFNSDKSVAEAPDNVDGDDQPLSMWMGGNISSGVSSVRTANGGKSDAIEMQIDIHVETPTKDEDQTLPFTKRSPVWKTIESMKVFKSFPQRPHFHPLIETKEEYREGSAIGIMVTFANLVDKITNLQFDDPRSTFDNMMENLLDLEKHGFDIKPPQGRINELLSIKGKQAQMSDESKYVETEMTEHSRQKEKFYEEMAEIRSKMAELQKRYNYVMSLMDNKDNEISRLKALAETINLRIQNARSEFEKVVKAPWKLP